MKTFYEYVYERDLLEAESPKKKILKKAAIAGANFLAQFMISPEEKALAKRQNQRPQQNISAPQAAVVKKAA